MKIPAAYKKALLAKDNQEEKQTPPADETQAPSKPDNALPKLVQDDADKAVETDKPTADVSTPAQVGELIDTSWLPFAASTYKISPNLNDYVIVNMPICPSDIPNRNGVAFPLAELIAYQPPPMNRMTYKAWTGCPVHLEHDNEDHEKAIGVIFDTSLRIMRGYGDGKLYVVYGLIGIDKTKDPRTAEKFLSGNMDTGSMGALADYFTCSVCGARATDNEFTNCSHIKSTSAVNWRIMTHEGRKVVAYLNAHVLSPIEYSAVADPAWATCLSDMILAR